MRIFWSAILLDSFSWKSHYCLVFESPPSRYNLMMRYDYQLFQWVVWSHSYRYQGGRLLLCSMSFLFIVRWCFLLTTHALVFLLRYSPRILHFARPVSSTTPVMGRHREPPSPRESSLSIDFGGSYYNSDKKKSSIVGTRESGGARLLTFGASDAF